MPSPRSPRLFSPDSPQRIRRITACIPLLLAAVILFLPTAHAQTSSYTQTNIVSDGSVPARKTDPTLINPWGISIGPELWINTAGTGFSLVEDAGGNKSFAVSIP